MKRLFTFLLFALPLIGTSQSYKKEFTALLQAEDTLAQKALLQKWERENSNDPELYVCYFNYHVNLSRQEVLSLQQQPQGEEYLEMKDSANQTAGYITSSIAYTEKHFNKALEYINKGISKNPARLDMRFGKCYLLGNVEDFEGLTKEVVTTLAYAKKINNKWTWDGNKPVEDPKNFMLNSIQGYVGMIYNTGDDNLLPYMQQIAEAVLKDYSDHIESLSNLSIVYMLQNQPDKALAPLFKAEKLNPKDYIVLGNIAHCYKLKGDKANAVKYYEVIARDGDGESKAFAKQQLEKLKQ
jgi:tetratricopeptide (TPR) repeat protein